MMTTLLHQYSTTSMQIRQSAGKIKKCGSPSLNINLNFNLEEKQENIYILPAALGPRFNLIDA